MENLARRYAIWLVAGIVRGVEAAIGVELPLLRRQPRPAPGFRSRRSRRRSAHARAPAMIMLRLQSPTHRKRPRIQLAHLLVIAGGDRGDGGVEILDDGALQVLRLKSFTAQRPVAAP